MSEYRTRANTYTCPEDGCRGCEGCYGEEDTAECACCDYVFEGPTGFAEHDTWYCRSCDIRACAGCIGEDDPSCEGCGLVFEHTSGPFDDDGNYIGNAESFASDFYWMDSEEEKRLKAFSKKIENEKKKLIAKAKRKGGVYEYFGHRERLKLEDSIPNVDYYRRQKYEQMVKDFDNWRREVWFAESFNAPYAGAGALMAINQNTPISNFTTNELTHSSTVQGDFNQASINSSGHQNFEVRGAETFAARGTYNLYKSQEKVLKAYRDSGGKENHYDSLPPKIVNKLESIRNSETLWSDVNRWLWDNPSTSKNPYGGFHSTWDAESFGAEMKDSHLTVSQRVLRAIHDQYPALYEDIEEGTQFPPEELEDTGDYDDAVDIAETMQLVRLLSADIRNASEPIREFYDITKTYPRGVENEMYAESFGADRECEDCGISGLMENTIYCDTCWESHGKNLSAEDSDRDKMIEEMNEWVKGLGPKAYFEFCYRFDIDPEDAQEMSWFIADHYDEPKVISWLETNWDKYDAESFGAEDIDDYIQRIFTFIDEKVGTEYFGSIEDEEEVIRFKQAFMDKFNEIEEPPIIDWNEILSAESFGADRECEDCGISGLMENTIYCDTCWESHGKNLSAEYGKRQRFGNRYVARDTKGKFISNVSVGRSLKADRRNKSKTPARSGFGHKGDSQKGASGGFKLPTDAKSVIGIGAVLGGLWAYLESKA